MGEHVNTAPAKAHVTKKSFGAKIRELQPSVSLCLIIIIILTFATIFAEWVVPHDPYEPDLLSRNQPPSLLNILGTDQIGRDTLSRTIFAIRTSVGIALYGVFAATLIGITLGISAGFLGGLTDRIISAIIDFFYAVPYLLIMLVGIVVLGTETWVVIVFISFARWHETHVLSEEKSSHCGKRRLLRLRLLWGAHVGVLLSSTYCRTSPPSSSLTCRLNFHRSSYWSPHYRSLVSESNPQSPRWGPWWVMGEII